MFAMNPADDATNISRAVREIKRVAADSLEESTSYNNDIYPALWHTDNDNVAAWQQASGRQGKRLSRNSPPLLITPLVFTLSSKSKPLSSSPPADWQEVSIRLIPSSPRRDLLSTSNMDSLHTEGKAVACRGQEESLNPELTSSTVGGDVTVVVWAS
ncbi:hypothetical protein EXN66_Car004438 [Channa argus]|uniref:Uncharacterized protein n=1 Tax=Channa argus TaxID=215402 RepID=A0A6G1PFF6_CHAAH|nr:hypothetical protein EXN66_Car004438 [Channa argus]